MAEDQEERPTSPMRAIVGLLLLVGLIVGVLFIMRQLQHAAAIQDCVASGRTNCAPIAAPPR
jgi:F0F1-type ATP synthase assembly protein I